MDGSFYGSRAAGIERDQVGHHHVRPVLGRHDHQCPTRDRFQGIKVKQLLFHTPADDAFPLHFTGNSPSDMFQRITRVLSIFPWGYLAGACVCLKMLHLT